MAEVIYEFQDIPGRQQSYPPQVFSLHRLKWEEEQTIWVLRGGG